MNRRDIFNRCHVIQMNCVGDRRTNLERSFDFTSREFTSAYCSRIYLEAEQSMYMKRRIPDHFLLPASSIPFWPDHHPKKLPCWSKPIALVIHLEKLSYENQDSWSYDKSKTVLRLIKLIILIIAMVICQSSWFSVFDSNYIAILIRTYPFRK